MIIPNKLQKRVVAGLKDNHVHKFRRFTKKNKTFRTDLYFCALCGKSVEINKSFGLVTICWKCGNPFNMNGTTPVYPKCLACTGSNQEVVTTKEHHPSDLSFMEETEPTKQELIENTLKELGLK